MSLLLDKVKKIRAGKKVKHRCIIGVSLLGVGGLIFLLLRSFFFLPSPPFFSLRPHDILQQSLTQKVLSLISDYYVGEVNEQLLLEGALNGLVSSLDPYSGYMTQEQYTQFLQNTGGEFGGIGLELVPHERGLRVVTPLDNSPASRAGILPGNIITHVDQWPVAGKPLSLAMQKLAGEIGSEVNLRVWQSPSTMKEVRLKRALVPIDQVTVQEQQGCLYIRIPGFNQKTGHSLRAVLEPYRSGKGVRGIILDLRNNPGGLLEASLETAGFFLGKKVLVKIVGPKGKKIKVHKGKGEPFLPHVPLLVLINLGSASGAEIVAAALKEHERGFLVGERTLGKGSVQTVIPLDGQGALRLTTNYFLSPTGKPINQEGVSPHLFLALPSDDLLTSKTMVERAYQILLAVLHFTSK